LHRRTRNLERLEATRLLKADHDRERDRTKKERIDNTSLRGGGKSGGKVQWGENVGLSANSRPRQGGKDQNREGKILGIISKGDGTEGSFIAERKKRRVLEEEREENEANLGLGQHCSIGLKSQGRYPEGVGRARKRS